jgi:hypothetical protein
MQVSALFKLLRALPKYRSHWSIVDLADRPLDREPSGRTDSLDHGSDDK